MPEAVDNVDIRANELTTSLTAGEVFDIPAIDLSGAGYSLPAAVTTNISALVVKLTNADLTTGVVGGTGTFDVLMKSLSNHLKDEFDKGRITGADYTRAYIAMTEAALGNAVQYLLGKDQSFWAAQRAQIEAYTASVQLETAKVQYAGIRAEALNQKANYALTKIKISNESIAFSTAKYNLTNMLPKQLALVGEQVEVQRAQTMDTRTDNVTVVKGSVGKQKELYSQQITSYQRDAEVKAAKLFTDAWITQKTIDEGLLAPTGFQNTSVDTILSKLKTVNGLV